MPPPYTYGKWFYDKMAKEQTVQAEMVKKANSLIAEAKGRYGLSNWKKMELRIAELMRVVGTLPKAEKQPFPDSFWLCCEIALAELEGRDPLG